MAGHESESGPAGSGLLGTLEAGSGRPGTLQAGGRHAGPPGGRHPLAPTRGRWSRWRPRVATGGRRRSRWRLAWRVTMISVVVLTVVLAGLATGVYLMASSYLHNVHRIGNPFASIPVAQRPARPRGLAGQDVTFLVGGLDTRSAVPTTGRGARSGIRGRTDTLMLVHLIAGGRGAYVVSIPRDSWVPIPGYGRGKVNWAYFFGGPSLAVRTVERLTHVRIDHVAIIDWDGFKAVTDALGGVTIDIPATSYDPANGTTWTAGVHHLDGTQALLYVRDRYGLPAGDFDRERRQQNFLRAVFTQLSREASLSDPLRLNSLISALTQAVSVDSTLGAGEMTHLALGLRGLSPRNVVFATVPYTGTGWAGSQSVVWLNRSLDRGFWHAFEYDSLPAFMRAHQLKRLGTTTP
ncbi:MAG TPA: LCP family protein [Streptosporangiaceae bacterium]